MKKNLLTLLLATLFGTACLEIGLNLFGIFQYAGKSPDNILWQPDTEIGFAPAVNLKAQVHTAEWMNEIQTNEFGFRVAEPALALKGAASESILFLGDSQTMATQVAVQDTYIYLIGRELDRKDIQLDVINAGCNGFNTVQEYLFFDKIYNKGLRPKFVIMYVTNNDLFQDVPRLPYGQVTLDGSGYLALKGPDPVLLEGLRKAKEMPQRQANFWLRNSTLLRHLFYSWRIWNNPHNVAEWIKSTYLRDELDPLAKERWAMTTAAVRSLNRLISSYGGRLIVAVHPDPIEWSEPFYAQLKDLVPELTDRIDRMKFQHGYRQVAQDVGISFVDMLKDFPKISVRDFRFAMDPHSNRSGHQIIAEQLLKGFVEIGLLK